jgi:hypothetical protein
MVRGWGQERVEGSREEKEMLTIAQVPTWPAWRGSARTANQARSGEDFTGAAAAARGATPPGLLRLTPTRQPTESAAQPHHDHHREAQLASGEGR